MVVERQWNMQPLKAMFLDFVILYKKAAPGVYRFLLGKDLDVFVAIVALPLVLLRVTNLDGVDCLADQIHDFAHGWRIILALC
jgi:hypothetical protein